MLYFDDLLKVDDFNQSVNDLATDFMREFGLAKVHQLGLVVKDVEEAAAKLADKAKKKLEEDTSRWSPDVVEHLEKIADGMIPFGLKVKE